MNKRGKEVISVDLGGTNLRVGIFRNWRIIRFVKKPTPGNRERILGIMCDLIRDLINKDVKGIGIACPGPLKNGMIINPPNIPFRNFDIKSYIEKKFRVEVEVENDAKCVALAESRFGYGKGKKNFFVLTLGTGIGGGVVIDGKLYNARDIGTELGNIYLDNEKRFEELAGGKGIFEITKKKIGKEINVSELIEMNNKISKEILDEISDYLAMGIGSLVNVFNPEIVILAGGMREAGEKFLDIVRKKIKEYVILPSEYEIVWSKLREPGLLGAGLLV